MRVISILLILLTIRTGYATTGLQLTVRVSDAKTRAPLIGAEVYFPALELGSATDTNGIAVISGLPRGHFILKVSYIGYETRSIGVTIPLPANKSMLAIELTPVALESQEIVVSSTRSNGVIEDVPVKVEVLGQSEVNEEVAIRPGNVSKLLGETSGVLVQPTSVVSGFVSFRLEGLPGRYTQLLEDGLPQPDKLTNGLTILQIPPLDLRQVEVVKGPSSLFYGNGAMAGFVNLITKKPGDRPELDVVLNATNRKGTDGSLYYSARRGPWGYSLLLSHSRQQPVDVSGNHLTDLPFQQQTVLKPRLFYHWGPNQNLELGIKYIASHREGGYLPAVTGPDSLGYLEKDSSVSRSVKFNYTRHLRNQARVEVKTVWQRDDRRLDMNGVVYRGRQDYSFTEVSYYKPWKQHKLVVGLNLVTDRFKQISPPNKPLASPIKSLDYSYYNQSFGLFSQDDWRLTRRLMLEPGMRIDHNHHYGYTYLPHLSILYKFAPNLTGRLSLGQGYQVPNVLKYGNYKPLAEGDIALFWPSDELETAQGLNVDLGYKFIRKELVLRFNEALFYNKLQRTSSLEPSLLACAECPGYAYYGDIDITSKGFDSNFYLALDELEFFADYTFNDVTQARHNNNYDLGPLTLTPRHKLNLTLTYEQEGSWRTGLEAFYTGPQYLPDSTYSRPYWLLGAMWEKQFSKFSLLFNVENLLDERQTRYDRVVRWVNFPQTPVFSELYMPLDGRVANVAVWVKL